VPLTHGFSLRGQASNAYESGLRVGKEGKRSHDDIRFLFAIA
jgi:hypothetical protein